MGKKKSSSSSSASSPVLSASVESGSTSKPSIAICGGVIKSSSSSAAKKRTEKALGQFLSDVLPALKKEMVRRKKEVFSWDAYSHYFKPDSKYVATFCLPLFRFLEKDEIVCSRYGYFENRHMVKTSSGFERVMLLSRNLDSDELPSDVQQYLAKRFGREWFKIPSKDGFRAKAAAASGHEGQFKVILVGLFEDSFVDSQTGETVLTINPSLMYEPLRPPPPKKERKVSKSSSKKEENKEEEEDVEESGNSSTVDVGAQEIPIEMIPEEEEGE